jgi:DNA polymerase I-like protein with 3'-5' exonuclease and polymerase domains
MLACDTETTGLFLQNGSTCFSIGVYDGAVFKHSTTDIDPRTRYRTKEHPKSLRSTFDNASLIVFHNSGFDLKALCESGIYDWNEPAEESFWKKIVDTTTLAHLYCSTDELSLDFLTQKYLQRDYPEDKELISVVDKCRRLTRTKRFKAVYGDWLIASAEGSHPSFLPCGKNNKWNRMDFWLPAAIRKHIPAAFRPTLSDSVLNSVMLRYLKADCVNTYELAEFYFHQLLERHGDQVTELLNINRQVEHIVWKMETHGLWVRPTELKDAQEACHKYIGILSQKVTELSGIEDITDTKLRKLFFQDWGFEPVTLTKTGNNSVDAKCILKLHELAQPGTKQHQFLSCYLSLKKYEKKLTSLQSYERSRSTSGYVHPSFNITGTKTTRFSSKNPNAQNITKAGNPYEDDAPDIARWLRASPSMRSCFGPPPDKCWIAIDYSQLQLRIFAYITQEPKLIESLEAGYDFHDTVARELFSVERPDNPTKAQRRIAKNCVFGVLFGASEKKIDATAGQPGMYKLLLSLFPSAHAFIEETKQIVDEVGYIETYGGYPLELKSHVNKWTGREEKAAHAAVNYIVQGAEGVIVKRAMALCDAYLTSEYPEGRIALQVHDEIVFEFPMKPPKKHIFAITRLMEQAAEHYGVIAPVEAEICFDAWDKPVKVRKNTNAVV